MAVRMVSAIARTIPTVAGFSAICPLLVPGCRIFIGNNRRRCVSYFTLRWLSKKCISNCAPASAQSMRDSAQVTAPGAIASMIVAVSTRPNRQNRAGGCWVGRAAPTCIREVTGMRNAPRVATSMQRPRSYTLHRQWLTKG